MKILLNKYPKGSLPHQKTAGRYIDEYLYENLQILAKAIVQDNTFLGIISSSTLEVGAGKSVFVSQMGEAWSEIMKKIHNIDVPFSVKNIVFNPTKLIERSFELPKYSIIILDEWEDAHYWSSLGMSLRQFFRKCRQLNLLIVCVIPNYFQLPLNYAVSRSVFFIDVRFERGFERGYFSFYNFRKKKSLYLKGKKTMDYSIVKPDFYGRFTDGYGIPREEYLAAKLKDFQEVEAQETKPRVTERMIKSKLFRQMHKNLPKTSIKDLARGFGISYQTAFRYLNDEEDTENEGVEV